MEEWILIWRLFKKFLLMVVYGKRKKFKTLQNIGYLNNKAISFQNLDVGNIKKQSADLLNNST
jgi:hypothetical protein